MRACIITRQEYMNTVLTKTQQLTGSDRNRRATYVYQDYQMGNISLSRWQFDSEQPLESFLEILD